jgi:hypothetical protein
MSFKSRLAKLEEILLGDGSCPHCHDNYVVPIRIYEEDSNGTLTLVTGTPPLCCPACGREASKDGITEVILPKPEHRCVEIQQDPVDDTETANAIPAVISP